MEELNEDILKGMYEQVPKIQQTGTFEQFREFMSTSEGRKAIYDNVEELQNTGSFEEFEAVVAKPTKQATDVEQPAIEAGGARTGKPLRAKDMGGVQQEETKIDLQNVNIPGPTGAPINLGFLKGTIFEDFTEDILRAAGRGYEQGAGTTESLTLLVKGAESTGEDLTNFVQQVDRQQKHGVSDEFKEFQEADGFRESLKAFAKNPVTITAELIVESTMAMARSGGAGIAASTLTGPAAVVLTPLSMGMTSAALETSGKMVEGMQEYLGERGLEFNEENIRTIFADEEAWDEIRAKAVTKGAVIGMVDGATAGLVSKMGGSGLVSNLAKTARKGGKIRPRFTQVATTGRQAAVEMASGGVGEIAGQLAVGEELDWKSAALEVIGEIPGAGQSVGSSFIINQKRLGKLTDAEMVRAVLDNNQDDFNAAVDVALGLGQITEQQSVELKDSYADIEAVNKTIPETVSDKEKRKAIIEKIQERKQIQTELERSRAQEVDEAFQDEQLDQVKELEAQKERINNEIKQIRDAQETRPLREEGVQEEGQQIGVGDMQRQPQQETQIPQEEAVNEAITPVIDQLTSIQKAEVITPETAQTLADVQKTVEGLDIPETKKEEISNKIADFSTNFANREPSVNTAQLEEIKTSLKEALPAEPAPVEEPTPTTSSVDERVFKTPLGEEFAVVPTSNEALGPNIIVDPDTYKKWQELDNEEQQSRESIESNPNIEPERKQARLKGIAQEYAARKRRVLGTTTEKERGASASKVREGDQVTSDGNTYEVVGKPSFGKYPVRNIETGETQRLDRNDPIIQKLITQKQDVTPDVAERIIGEDIQADLADRFPEELYGIRAENKESLSQAVQLAFGLSPEQADASAAVMDGIVANMARRAGITKTEMYNQIEFRRGGQAVTERLQAESEALFQGPNIKENNASKTLSNYEEFGVLYHGTSNEGISNLVLPPSTTGVISEQGRKKNLEKVFFTKTEKSAQIYAGRARNVYGGEKRVLAVVPIGSVEVLNDRKGTEVLMSDAALVVDPSKDIPSQIEEYYNSLESNPDANFERWKGDAELLEDEFIGADAETGAPVVVKVYHGTTHDFYEFDTSQKGTTQGFWGQVNYFTSDLMDAETNYTNSGGDLKRRLESRKFEVSKNINDEYAIDAREPIPEEYIEEIADIYGVGADIIRDRKMSAEDLGNYIANQELRGDKPQVMEVYVKMNNPIVIGRDAQWVNVMPEELYQDSMEDAANEIAEEYDITPEQALEDYRTEVVERAIDMEGAVSPVVDALEQALDDNVVDFGGYTKSAAEILEGLMDDSEIDLNKVAQTIREEIPYAQNEYGEHITPQVVADFFKNLGYDGIIMPNAYEEFGHKGPIDEKKGPNGLIMNPYTSHVHIFDEFSNNIKLADGRNVEFNPDTRDIRFQKTQGAVIANDGNFIIYGLTDPNISTPLHEIAHVYEHYLTDAERDQVLNWTGQDEWNRDTSEKFARGFEKYLAEGKAPNKKLKEIFDQFKKWLLDIYNEITGSDIDLALNDDMRQIYRDMIRDEAQLTVGEQMSEIEMEMADMADRLSSALIRAVDEVLQDKKGGAFTRAANQIDSNNFVQAIDEIAGDNPKQKAKALFEAVNGSVRLPKVLKAPLESALGQPVSEFISRVKDLQSQRQDLAREMAAERQAARLQAMLPEGARSAPEIVEAQLKKQGLPDDLNYNEDVGIDDDQLDYDGLIGLKQEDIAEIRSYFELPQDKPSRKRFETVLNDARQYMSSARENYQREAQVVHEILNGSFFKDLDAKQIALRRAIDHLEKDALAVEKDLARLTPGFRNGIEAQTLRTRLDILRADIHHFTMAYRRLGTTGARLLVNRKQFMASDFYSEGHLRELMQRAKGVDEKGNLKKLSTTEEYFIKNKSKEMKTLQEEIDNLYKDMNLRNQSALISIAKAEVVKMKKNIKKGKHTAKMSVQDAIAKLRNNRKNGPC